jgi:hypothetical protein
MTTADLGGWRNTKRLSILEPGQEYAGFLILECIDGHLAGRAEYRVECLSCGLESKINYIRLREREKIGTTTCRRCRNGSGRKADTRKRDQEPNPTVVLDAHGYPWMKLTKLGFRHTTPIARNK